MTPIELATNAVAVLVEMHPVDTNDNDVHALDRRTVEISTPQRDAEQETLALGIGDPGWRIGRVAV